MKFIISESQDRLVKLERLSDLMYNLTKTSYPDLYEHDKSEYDPENYSNEDAEIEVYSNYDKDLLLFYYQYDKKEFYIGADFLDELYSVTKLDVFDIDKIIDDKNVIGGRRGFDDMIKLFAKKHYGWDVNNVWFHWH